MTIEIFLKNSIFLSLFLSMICFWIQLVQPNSSSKISAQPDFISANLNNLSQVDLVTAKGKSEVVVPISYGENFLILTFLGLTFDLIYRWVASNHIPLSNLYESLLFLNWNFLFLFFIFKQQNGSLVIQNRFKKDQPQQINSEKLNLFFGALMSSTILFIQSFADWQLPDQIKQIQPLIPALQSNWLLMHVSIMILSYAALFLGCLLAITYVFTHFIFDIFFLKSEISRTSSDTETFSSSKKLYDFLTEKLDSLSYRILAFAFPLLTLGILSGAVWANEAWGSYWSWDPKETWAFITWLVFAFYLHTRLQHNWEGLKSAQVASIGFFIIWICYLGVNLLGKGLHSYGFLTHT